MMTRGVSLALFLVGCAADSKVQPSPLRDITDIVAAAPYSSMILEAKVCPDGTCREPKTKLMNTKSGVTFISEGPIKTTVDTPASEQRTCGEEGCAGYTVKTEAYLEVFANRPKLARCLDGVASVVDSWLLEHNLAAAESIAYRDAFRYIVPTPPAADGEATVLNGYFSIRFDIGIFVATVRVAHRTSDDRQLQKNRLRKEIDRFGPKRLLDEMKKKALNCASEE